MNSKNKNRIHGIFLIIFGFVLLVLGIAIIVIIIIVDISSAYPEFIVYELAKPRYFP